MNLGHLQLFAKVVQSGSFTGAADAMDTQKSYVSRVVAQLEAELGVKLLERTTRSIALTEVGREVYERAVGILGAVDDTRRVAQRAQGQPRGQLRLTCGAEFGLLAVGGWIDEYLARYPEVSVEAEYTSRVLDLVHEGFDLAVRIGEVQESRLVARRLGQLEYGLFATPDYLRRNGLPAEPAELREHALIMFSPGGRRAAWELSLGAAGAARETQRINGPARLRVNNSFAVRDAVLRGLGIGQLPLLVAAQPGGQRAIAARAARLDRRSRAGARGVPEQPLPVTEGARLHRPGAGATAAGGRCGARHADCHQVAKPIRATQAALNTRGQPCRDDQRRGGRVGAGQAHRAAALRTHQRGVQRVAVTQVLLARVVIDDAQRTPPAGCRASRARCRWTGNPAPRPCCW